MGTDLASRMGLDMQMMGQRRELVWSRKLVPFERASGSVLSAEST